MRVDVVGAEAEPELVRCMAAATRARKLRRRDEAADVEHVKLSSGSRVVAVDDDDGRWLASEARSAPSSRDVCKLDMEADGGWGEVEAMLESRRCVDGLRRHQMSRQVVGNLVDCLIICVGLGARRAERKA
jgi:hypothetical protein